MAQQDVLEKALRADDPSEFRELQSYLPAEWIEDALRETKRDSARKRRLPAFATTWVVIAMALFRDRAIEEVVAHLGLARSSNRGQTNEATVGSGAIAEARKRLGAKGRDLGAGHAANSLPAFEVSGFCLNSSAASASRS